MGFYVAYPFGIDGSNVDIDSWKKNQSLSALSGRGVEAGRGVGRGVSLPLSLKGSGHG